MTITDKLAALFGPKKAPEPPIQPIDPDDLWTEADPPRAAVPPEPSAASVAAPAAAPTIDLEPTAPPDPGEPAAEGAPYPPQAAPTPGPTGPRFWSDFDRDEADADRMFWPGQDPRRVVIDVSKLLSEQVSRTLMELNRREIFHSVDHKLAAASADGSRIVQISRPTTKVAIEDAVVCAAFVEPKTKRDGTVVPETITVMPTPRPLIDAIFERGDYPELRALIGIRRDAFVGPDGRIVSKPGYDSASGLMLSPRSADYRGMPEVVTKDNAIAALRELDEVLVDFPLTPAGRSVAIASMLACAARPALGPTPMIIADAPAAGSGKTLLVEECATIGLGEAVKSDMYRAEPAEFSKTLISAAMDGKGAIIIDNVSGAFGSAELDGMITARTGRMGVRLLGQSKKVEVSTETVVFATGNGVTLAGDGARRALWITLDAGVENPEERTGFKHKFLHEWVQDNLARLHRAVLLLWEGFRQAGSPESGRPPLGSFEKWSANVRDLLLWLGLPDPTDTREKSKERDPDREFLAAVLPAIEKLDPLGKGLYVQQIVAAAGASAGGIGAFNNGGALKHPELTAALMDFATPTGAINSRLLSRRLKQFERRIIGGRRLTSKKVAAQRVWFVEVTDADVARSSASASTEPAN